MRIKELTRIALGSVTGALLGAVAFLGVEGAAPRAAVAQVYGVNVYSSPIGSDLDVYLQSSPIGSDKDDYVAGQCRGTGSTDVYFQTSPIGSDEDWYIQSSPIGADMEICLSGDLQAFNGAR